MKKNSPISALVRKANNGSLKATYTLFEYYSKGIFVDKDDEKAKFYSDLLYSRCSNKTLRILSVSLDCFRGFRQLRVSLPENRLYNGSVIIVGENGVGKSSVLEALSKGLGWFSQRFINPVNRPFMLSDYDIYRSGDKLMDVASIIVQFSFAEAEEFSLLVSKSTDESSSTLRGSYEEISTLSGIYRHLFDQNPNVALPLVAYYGVDRAVAKRKSDFGVQDSLLKIKKQNQFDGYKKSLSGNANFHDFFIWFKNTQDILNNREARSNSEIEVEKLIKENLSSALASADSEDQRDNIKRIIEYLSHQEVKSELGINSVIESNSSSTPPSKIIEVVSRAISKFLPDFKNLRVQYEPILDLVLEKDLTTLSVLQLSHGERSLFALVADIARRLVLLNPKAADPLEGDGIVIIDEIDMHLHPEWQQNIFINLTSTFPNIQFILSTHSPLVLSTVPRDCVRVLSVTENGVGISEVPHLFTYGELSGDVMQGVMGVDPQPPIPEKALLEELTLLVDQGQYDSNRASELLIDLKARLRDEHPQMQKIYRSIRRQKALSK